jgi:hypothetical protein
MLPEWVVAIGLDTVPVALGREVARAIVTSSRRNEPRPVRREPSCALSTGRDLSPYQLRPRSA